ncbi:MAG: MerR family transcriptional regulator [Synergistaceae bacterium]|nr:MerR family transcriptional regulator [Synergistaceae bacterium]
MEQHTSAIAGLLSVGELAKFARVTRTTIRHYNNLKLITPALRDTNRYRYYSFREIAVINLIVTLRDLGVPLKTIVRLQQTRTPEKMVKLFEEQNGHIEEGIAKLRRSQKLLLTLKSIIENGIAVEEEKIEVHWAEAETILMGPQIDYSQGRSIEEATLDFYKYCKKLNPNLDLNYPVWGMYSEKRIKKGDWVGPDRFYFRMPDAPDEKPKGWYLTGYTRGNYGQSDALYRKLLDYAKAHDIEICGPAWEMYPLNEISIASPDDYLMRISMTVKNTAGKKRDRKNPP